MDFLPLSHLGRPRYIFTTKKNFGIIILTAVWRVNLKKDEGRSGMRQTGYNTTAVAIIQEDVMVTSAMMGGVGLERSR